ncbi:unnamed protein product, partial [marine sediment metagenome]
TGGEVLTIVHGVVSGDTDEAVVIALTASLASP